MSDEREKKKSQFSVLNILRRAHNLQLPPQTNTNHGAKRKQNAQGNAQTPDTLQLETGRLGRAGPDPVVDLAHVLAYGGEEGGGAAAGVGQGGAVEVREGLADCDGDDDDGDEDGGVEGGGDEEGEHGVPVEDVGD